MLTWGNSLFTVFCNLWVWSLRSRCLLLSFCHIWTGQKGNVFLEGFSLQRAFPLLKQSGHPYLQKNLEDLKFSLDELIASLVNLRKLSKFLIHFSLQLNALSRHRSWFHFTCLFSGPVLLLFSYRWEGRLFNLIFSFSGSPY